MAKTIKIDKIGQLIDEEPYYINWFSYIFSGGWGSRLTKYTRQGAARGILTPGIRNTVPINKVFEKLQNDDFSDIAGFYVGILCFFGEKIYKNLNFVEKIPHNSINYVVSNLGCPTKYKNEIEWICYNNFDFIDFIEAASKLDKISFDKKTAISTYKLQGDDAIFGILCQMFYVNKGVESLNISLINDIPVDLPIDISNYVSGCHFPVAVSPSISEFKWEENQNGWFLYGKYKDEWRVLDVAGVGFVNLSNYSLANRLNYLGGGGEAVPYLICWNWGEVVKAYHHFGGNLLIRDLKNDLFSHYWFNFGPDSLLNVRFKDGFINIDKRFLVKPGFDGSLVSVDKQARAYLCVDLAGGFADYCKKKDVFYSDAEVFDWFELGRML